ncbi:transcriptional regulator with XRE-family HTH domain [Sphingomonas insulae]|uniref:HTH cro/C1-type domain-containing protein n=1 Tax=Sphingomonas insulae TaxID=424800 RepID=A0ABN1HKV2_9SPHN|nr:helix-turn-helix transcriptional regulator [Sphingomonas insulae]NIJ30383.1 transcriptional regulator with XRE-family HTH domain [Sphingomonas insulae]
MITAIRQVRRAKNLTLDEVARRCVPPTTAQTIGRLETGTRTVSVAWLNRIAAALDVAPADLVTLPDRAALPVAATLDAEGAHAPRQPLTLTAPQPSAGGVAIAVTGSTADYRAGDHIWCDLRAPDAFTQALNRDVLVPVPAGRFLFARLIGIDGDALLLLPLTPGARPTSIASPAWLAQATRLIRTL